MLDFQKDLKLTDLDYANCNDFTYDGKYIYIATQGNRIYKINEEGAVEEIIQTRRSYYTISYDEQGNCFWGVAVGNRDIVHQLSPEFQERGYMQMRFQNRRRNMISLLSYSNKTQQFFAVCNRQMYVGERNGYCRLLSGTNLFHVQVECACMNDQILVYVGEVDHQSILYVINRADGREMERLVLPESNRIKSIRMDESSEEQDIYTIRIMGVQEEQVCIQMYKLKREEAQEIEEMQETQEIEEAQETTEVVPEKTRTIPEEIDDPLSMIINMQKTLEGAECCGNYKDIEQSCHNHCGKGGCNRTDWCRDKYCQTDCCQDNCRKECCGHNCDCRCACVDILESIACQEASLAHILNAEGEKLQLAVKKACNIEDLLCVNQSVQQTIMHTCHLEQVLYAKMECALVACKNTCKKC